MLLIIELMSLFVLITMDNEGKLPLWSCSIQNDTLINFLFLKVLCLKFHYLKSLLMKHLSFCKKSYCMYIVLLSVSMNFLLKAK